MAKKQTYIVLVRGISVLDCIETELAEQAVRIWCESGDNGKRGRPEESLLDHDLFRSVRPTAPGRISRSWLPS